MLKNKSIILAVGESSMNDDKPAMVDWWLGINRWFENKKKLIIFVVVAVVVILQIVVTY